MTRRHLFMTVCASLVLFAAALGASEQVAEAPLPGQGTSPPGSLQLEQSYHGVTPGSGNQLPRVEELKGKPGTWVTWPGFLTLDDGGSRVFVQTTVAVTFEKTAHKTRIVLKLRDARVHLTNNRNPLVTTHFNTPLNRAYLKQRAKTTELVLELKVAASPEITQLTDQDGYHYMFIDFPPGDYPKGDTTEPRPALSGYGNPNQTAASETADTIPVEAPASTP